VVSKWDIESIHGCPKCKNNKISPSDLSLVEKLTQIAKHPKVWRWADAEYK
jgi:hypothetical protein